MKFELFLSGLHTCRTGKGFPPWKVRGQFRDGINRALALRPEYVSDEDGRVEVGDQTLYGRGARSVTGLLSDESAGATRGPLSHVAALLYVF